MSKNTHWLEGFVKFASDCGVSTPQDVKALLKVHQTLSAQRDNPAEFEKGAAAVMEKSGVDWKTVLALIAGGVGTQMASQGFKGWKHRVGQDYVNQRTGNQIGAISDLTSQKNMFNSLAGMLNPQQQGPRFGIPTPFAVGGQPFAYPTYYGN